MLLKQLKEGTCGNTFREDVPQAPAAASKHTFVRSISVCHLCICSDSMQYCIAAQVMLAKKAGASDDEIKAAIQIAGEIARFSILRQRIWSGKAEEDRHEDDTKEKVSVVFGLT